MTKQDALPRRNPFPALSACKLLRRGILQYWCQRHNQQLNFESIMQLSWPELLNEINDLFIKITRDKIFKNEKEDFLSHVKQCLKLNKTEDWNYILASEDILEDSNAAIINFLRFGISGPTKYDEIGEKYLRLYGVLNATYMQQQAIYNLFRFFQCNEVHNKKKEIDSLEIVTIRHKLAAHSANYEDPESGKMHVFVPVRMELNDFECSYFNHYNDEYKTVNLTNAIEEHLKLMYRIYIEVVKKTVTTVYKCNKDKRQELISKVEPFEKMLSGCGLMKNQATGEYMVISYVSAN
ncbi:MAG: hypothetical protein GY814_16390 [Gammaproteobacteria bacterium]|nr:hypothetical protein [Gammaproteobacteria bacterium]